MKRRAVWIGIAALTGAAIIANAEMKNLVDIPITIPPGTEPVVLEVHVGPLHGRAEVLVETLEGEYVGSISTFGFNGIAPAGYPQIAVDRKPEMTGDLRLTGKIVLNGVERPATPEELRGIRLVSP